MRKGLQQHFIQMKIDITKRKAMGIASQSGMEKTALNPLVESRELRLLLCVIFQIMKSLMQFIPSSALASLTDA